MNADAPRPEEGLDPEDWEALRGLGHRMVDDMLDYLRTVGERAPWTAPPAAVRARLAEALPRAPQGAERAYRDFRENVLPHPTGNIHPRFWGWVMGTGSPSAMLAEMLAAGLNPNVGGFDDGASLVEDTVVAWLKELMGFPADGSGILVSGGSLANLVGLSVARQARAGFDVRRHGLAAAPRRPVLYASSQTHNSVHKGVELLGLGRDALRLIGVGADYRVDVAALAAAVAADRAAGLQPFCVVGNAGTVNTGATDDLTALADLCAREGLWLHVDGAFGAWAAASPDLRERVRGIERADSLAFDLHKWGYFPIEAGCTLVRHPADHRSAFAMEADYLAVAAGGIAARSHRFAEYGVQLSRGFRALKIWMGLKEHGADKFGRLIRQNVEQAAYLAARVSREPELELTAPVPLNIVCFRYRAVPPGVSSDQFNETILVRLQESGVAVPSYTRLQGAYCLRVAITNHRTRRADLDLLVDEVLRLGRALAAEGR